jgi:arylsulfatase A-like enzyme
VGEEADEASVVVDRWLVAMGGGFGLGLWASGFEVATLPVRLTVPLAPIELFVAAVAGGLAMGLFGAILAVTVGGLVLWRGRAAPAPEAVGGAIAVAALGVTGFHVWAAAWALWTESRAPASYTLSVLPFVLAGIAYVNARYWVRRIEVGRSVAWGWFGLSTGAMLVGAGVGAVGASARPTLGEATTGNSVVLVTVDGLRRDAVQVFGGDPMPALDALGRDGMVFADTVTPTPDAGAANATLLTGLHPVRHGHLGDGDGLKRAIKTLPEAIAAEGWTTAAFVSHASVAAPSGLASGFLTFDDRFYPAWARMAILEPLAGYTASRRARDTTRAFLSWLDAHPDRPFFAWVHLADPAVATPGAYSEATLQVDVSIQQIREALEARSRPDTALIVAGTSGVMRGERGLTGSVGLFDPVVRVPLVVRVPRFEPTVPRVTPQVRLMDVPATILEILIAPTLLKTEGVSLLGYATGWRETPLGCTLIGRSADGGWQMGVRNNGVKYLAGAGGQTEQLFDLSSDPREEVDIAASQPDIVTQARAMMAADAAALAARTAP